MVYGIEFEDGEDKIQPRRAPLSSLQARKEHSSNRGECLMDSHSSSHSILNVGHYSFPSFSFSKHSSKIPLKKKKQQFSKYRYDIVPPSHDLFGFAS